MLLASMIVFLFLLRVLWLEIRLTILPGGMGMIGVLPGYLLITADAAVVVTGLVRGCRKRLWALYGVAALVSFVLLGTVNLPYALYSLLKLQIFL